MVPVGRGVPRLPRVASLTTRGSLRRVWQCRLGVGLGRWPLDVFAVWASALGDVRHDLSPDENAVERVVRGGMAFRDESDRRVRRHAAA